MKRLLPILVVCAIAFASGGAFAAPAPSADRGAGAAAQTIVHLLDYIGVDYAEAVADGKVKNADEFKEMMEFASQIAGLLKSLPPVPQQPSLVAEAETLGRRVGDKAPPPEIAAAASKLRWAVVGAYRIPISPKTPPDLAAGARLYQSLCAGCHGAQGKGDGPAGAKLDPTPSNFHDTDRMAQRSAYGLYNAISLGVAGTGMVSFKQLSDGDRWALAFYAAGFPLEETRKQGQALWQAGKGREAFPDIANAATLSANEVKEKFGADAVAVQAWLLANPQALAAGKPAPMAFAQRTLQEALAAYRKGDRAAAQKLAITAYLEGYELAEAGLRNVDAQLVQETEREMMVLRALIQRGAPVGEVEQQHEKVAALLARSQEKLSGEALSPTAAFVSSLLILLREGLEAILVLAAIIAFLAKAGRRDVLPYVHAGWGLALVLGLATWFVATYAIDLSGADREITEGVTALLAAAMLLYVGFWLHDKSHTRAWQRFIRDQVGAALEKRTLWAMAAVSFLAVYRELFEVVLFYQALWAQTGADTRYAVFAGMAAAAMLLAVIGWAIFKYSLRLPVGPFFAVMSALLAALAIVFTGNGIKALQEAGVVAASPFGTLQLPALGIYATGESLVAQAVTVLLIVAAYAWTRSANRKGPNTA